MYSYISLDDFFILKIYSYLNIIYMYIIFTKIYLKSSENHIIQANQIYQWHSTLKLKKN